MKKILDRVKKTNKNFKKGGFMRNKNKIRFVLSLSILSLILLSIVLVFSTGCKKQEKVIKIGAILPLTGGAASYGVEEQRGMEIAVSEINATGGINGKKLEVQYEDSKGNVQDALNALRNIRNNGITIVFTSLTGPSKAIKPIAVNEGFLQIIFGMTDDLPQDAPNVFRIYPSLSEEGYMFIKYAQLFKPKKIAILYLDNVAFDYLVSKIMEPELKKMDVQFIMKETFTPDKIEGIKASIQKIKANKVEVLFVAAYYNYIPTILKEIHVQKLYNSTKIIGGLDIPIAVFTLKDFDIKLVEDIICAIPKFMMYLSDTTYILDEAKKFINAYMNKYNTLPTYDAAYGYDAIMILAEAIKRAGTVDIESLKNNLIGLTINKASGKITILNDGNSQTEWLLTKFQNGKLKELK